MIRRLQGHLHENFKAHVRGRRGRALRGDEKTLFSGEVWAATQARELGLIDGLGSLRAVLRAKFGETCRLRMIERKRPLFRLGPWRGPGMAAGGAGTGSAYESGAGAAGTALADGLADRLFERALWARYGL